MPPRDTLSIDTHAPDETRRLGARVGALAPPGSVVTLSGEMGAGKTRFAQGMALGLGVPKDCYITSPTYAIINEYPGDRPFFHSDLYRVSDPFELELIGFYEKIEKNGVTAVEWPERLGDFPLACHLDARIKITGEKSRRFIFFFNGQGWKNLLQSLTQYAKGV
ncbi:tRNA (Adenosine(37)-N6)-threonylcarbamoyltransferase complex ATPase subunit type 1 TsaE [Candidatus Desulfarcum epimagneticum]|uniref:tRNA threonylcarbamoyladenosine biosynthesis protein TsaE n=1 Tax=uncultured Desulfobacteraceae bacterium TaxID=218296 RepID=A0A484HJJ0_9BACT|nr:tRNA (Adenosine(37)-N6)-threonylcarbamoyltransferase complex ATPase subunit type 1 TsaE [uncultured Desulfobacteraceae bacterium]